MNLFEKQVQAWRVLNGQSRRIVFDGGARSGKTDVVLAWMIAQMSESPGSRQLIARKCLDHVKSTIWRQSLAKMIGRDNRFKWHEQNCELHLPKLGSMIVLAGLDDADRVDKILGSEYLHAFLNESTQLSWPTVQQVMTRLSQQVPGCPVRKLILDCNPKNQRHWLYKAGVLHVDPDTGEPLKDADTWARLHWTPYDNPYLPADYMLTLESLTGVKRRRMLSGEWCDNEGAVYEEFDEDIHVYRELPPGLERCSRLRAIDFGYTNPFVCLWAIVDHDGRIWIYHEHYRAGATVRSHAEQITEYECIDYEATVADHDAEDRATLAESGIDTIPARKDVSAGIQAVKDRLKIAGDGRPRLMVHESCKRLISEFFEYVWSPATDAKNAKEEPVKANDHAMDALRYLCMHLDKPTSSAGALADDDLRVHRDDTDDDKTRFGW